MRTQINLKILFSFIFIVFIFLSGQFLFAQNLNPPFPRIGQIYFYPTGSGDEIWKKHDLIGIRHYLSDDARRIREKNPDIIILGANDAIEGIPVEEQLGKKLPEEWYVHYANGDRLKIWGGFLTNITEKCPEADFIYGRQKFNQFVAQYLVDNTDWNYFDGSYWDSWISGMQWMGFDMDQIDFDYDGQADGASTIQGSWSRGNEAMIQNQRALNDKLIIAHEAVELYLNGNAFEFWSQVEDPPNGHVSNLSKLINFKNNATAPVINYCNGEADGALFRADLTSAMLGDGFFGHDEGTYAHRYTYLHDEYETNLGYPTSSPEEIESGLWIRYFDFGAIISNISGQRKTVRSSQLNGGPYWRFRGSQDPNLNNGDPFDANHPISFEGMDGIILLKEKRTLITPIIIDNVAHNMTSIDQDPVRYTGNWEQTIKGRDYYGVGYAWDEWGAYFAFSQSGTGNNTATYKPRIKVAGDYEVFEWHGRHDQPSASNVPYSVKRDGAVITTGRIDQTVNIGQWNSLGVFSLSQGNSFEIVLSNNANGIIISDAIKFEFIGDENIDREPPNSPKNLQNPEKTEHSLKLQWQAPDPASDGDVAQSYTIYRDGNLLGSTSQLTFKDTGLNENTSYSYNVFAFDEMGNKSVNPASGSFTTAADNTPPTLVKAVPVSLELVEVEFSEPVTTASATKVQNYAIDKGITVSQAELNQSNTIVRLKTSRHSPGETYKITVQNIYDTAKQGNVISSNNSFSYTISNKSFSVVVTADDKYELFVNGVFVGRDSAWEQAEVYQSLPLLAGKNVIAIKAENLGSSAGIAAEIFGSDFTFFSNPNWKYSKELVSGWSSLSFDDRSWGKATSQGLVSTGQPWITYQKVDGITNADKVHWIWSTSSNTDKVIYFRFMFNSQNLDLIPPAIPQGIVVRKN